MANQSINFKDLNEATNISSIGFDGDEGDLQSVLDPYSIYVEERISNDKPKDSSTNLYDLYDAGINILTEYNWKIKVGERITSHTQIYCKNNYTTITSNFASTSGGDFNKIHYDDLMTQLSGLESLTTESAMTALVMKWINDYVNDMTVNQNPENADDSNLILTQEITSEIKTITENILKKVFRNLVQLVRFKRDYRMYGPRSTIYGNCYTNRENCQKYTAVPASCFTHYANNYIVGKSAYGDNIANVADKIENAKWHISPYNSYAIAKHTHDVTINIGNLPTIITSGHNVLKSCIKATEKKNVCYTKSTQSGISAWNKQKDDTAGIVDFDDNNQDKHVAYSGSYHYSWNSLDESACKLVSKSEWNKNPWNNNEVKLPTYSTLVWVWTKDDDATNIANPIEFITAR